MLLTSVSGFRVNKSEFTRMKKQTARQALMILTGILTMSCGRNADTATPQVKPLLEAVYASGYVVAQNQYQVFAQAEGYVAAKLAEDGALVKKGDPLYIIESDQQSARLKLAQENYAVAAEHYGQQSPVLQELAAQRASAKSRLAFDSLNATRYANLLKSNATTQVEYERMRLMYNNSRNDYEAAVKRYERTRDQLYLEWRNARSQLEIAGSERGRYILRSDLDGRVFRTMKDVGELVRRTEAVAIVGDENNFELQLSVDELDIQRIQVGQEVLAKIDAYPGQVYRARVSKIFPMVNAQQQSLRVDATLDEPLPQAYSGLALEANIIIRRATKAVVIPRQALLTGDSVWIQDDGGKRKVAVKKGIETLDEVEIQAGLDTNTVIYIRH